MEQRVIVVNFFVLTVMQWQCAQVFRTVWSSAQHYVLCFTFACHDAVAILEIFLPALQLVDSAVKTKGHKKIFRQLQGDRLAKGHHLSRFGIYDRGTRRVIVKNSRATVVSKYLQIELGMNTLVLHN